MQISDSFTRCVMLLCFSSAFLILCVQVSQMLQKPAKVQANKATIGRETLQKTVSRERRSFEPLSQRLAPKGRVVVDLSDRRIYHYQGNKLTAKYPVAVGQKGWETPIGSFNITRMEKDPVWQQPITKEVVQAGGKNPLGDRWIGFWTDGTTQIGFHGTPDETKVGLAISHGCLRMRNQDIRQLYEKVDLGTPVKVQH
jgi:L,D-transpeptidase ErfK/SrfK